MNPDEPHDDDDDVLGPDAEPDEVLTDENTSPGERARARVFADLIDKMMAGRTPAAVPAEEQPLLEVATAIRATVRPVDLAAGRQRSIIESALATAIDRRGGGARTSASGLPAVSIDALGPRRRVARAPWIVAAATSLVAAAAVVMLIVQQRRPAPPPAPDPVAVKLPFDQRSRPADALVGAIARERAAAAADRIDAIYADRLSGFRDRTLSGGGSR